MDEGDAFRELIVAVEIVWFTIAQHYNGAFQRAFENFSVERIEIAWQNEKHGLDSAPLSRGGLMRSL